MMLRELTLDITRRWRLPFADGFDRRATCPSAVDYVVPGG